MREAKIRKPTREQGNVERRVSLIQKGKTWKGTVWILVPRQVLNLDLSKANPTWKPEPNMQLDMNPNPKPPDLIQAQPVINPTWNQPKPKQV